MNLERQNSLKIRTTEARLLGGFKVTGLRWISSARDMSMLKQLSALFSTILPYGRESAALQLLHYNRVDTEGSKRKAELGLD